jgi:hypothetical protein
LLENLKRRDCSEDLSVDGRIILKWDEVLTAVNMSMLVFCVVTPCGLDVSEVHTALKMEVVCSSEQRRYDPEDQHRQILKWILNKYNTSV